MNVAPDSALVVFTGESVDHIQEQGGTGSWALDRERARHCAYVVCTRNVSNPYWGNPNDVPHRTGFLIGKVEDVVSSTDHLGRKVVTLSATAPLEMADLWPT